jgi:predicted AlkP superfamily pyrophosphatase or phosphodiesterase
MLNQSIALKSRMNQFKKNLFALLLLGALAVQAQPKLVVGIVVDQMRYDYLYRFQSKFSETGFKRLMREGANCKNTNYIYVPTYTGPGHASIYTGTTPAVHGIISNKWYDKSSDKQVYCCEDKSVSTVGSAVSDEGLMSPQRCITGTFGDELRLFTNKKSKVIGVALKDRGAILPAGHMANAAYWFSSKDGNWISSTYYMNTVPKWVEDFNAQKLSDVFLGKKWETSFPIGDYTESLADDNPYEEMFKGEIKPVFPHDLPAIKASNDGYGLLKEVPFGNTLTKDFAINAIKSEMLGKGNVTDILTLSFSSTDYVGHRFGVSSIELEDTYIKLDKDLSDLLIFLDSYVGKENVLVFLTADHGAVENPQYLLDSKMKGGYVDEKKINEGLKKMLKDNFSDSLLSSFSNQQVFFNHAQVEKKKINEVELEKATIKYLLSQSYVRQVMTKQNILDNQFTDIPRSLIQLGFSPTRSGDLVVVYEPSVIELSYGKKGTTHGAPYSYDTHVPLLWWGYKIPKTDIVTPINITDIAPTVSMFLNTQFPNGCTGKPITDLFK